MSPVPRIDLHDGTTIPQLGFGTYLVPPEDARRVVGEALEVGYRHVDTAQMYGNEEGVGLALADAALPRDDLYVTTKLNNQFHRPDDVRRTMGESLERLGLDRVDLFLVHWPLPMHYGGDYVSTWRAMAGLVDEGLATSVGVSNFQPAHLDRIVEETGVVPVVNQVEVHPFFGNEAVRSANARHGIRTEAWSPIAKGQVAEDDTIRRIAGALDRTPAQVALRWAIQRGDIVFPKSMSRERMAENFALFDFELDAGQVDALARLDRGEPGRLGPNPDEFDYLPG